MSEAYSFNSTSPLSSVGDDVPLNDGELTRRVLRPTIVENQKNLDACLRATIVHQKRHSKNEPWQDYDAFNLATLKAGQEVKLELRSEETLRLYQALQWLYDAAADGVQAGTTHIQLASIDDVVFKGQEKEILSRLLLEFGGDDFIDALEQLHPGMLKHAAFIQEQERRMEALQEYRDRMEDNAWDEPAWARFFKRNLWIFGHGLDYQIHNLVTEQANYGGGTVEGTGLERGDYLFATGGHAKFTVLVEIKRPDTPLLTGRPYRNGAYAPSSELSGGVAQLQTNCNTWNVDTSRTSANRDLLESDDIYTCEPCGILVVGNLMELTDESNRIARRNKLESFHRFRKNLQNPEVLTFDELYARADFIVNHSVTQHQQEATQQIDEYEQNFEPPF